MIKSQVTEIVQPIAGVEIQRLVRELIAHRNVPMGVDKVVNSVLLQHFTGIHNLGFFLVCEDINTVRVGLPAFCGAEPCDGESLPWMEHAVKYPVGLEPEDVFDEQVFSLLPA